MWLLLHGVCVVHGVCEPLSTTRNGNAPQRTSGRIAAIVCSCSFSSARMTRIIARICGRAPPRSAFRELRAFPSALRGPVECSHGRQRWIAADCRCRRTPHEISIHPKLVGRRLIRDQRIITVNAKGRCVARWPESVTQGESDSCAVAGRLSAEDSRVRRRQRPAPCSSDRPVARTGADNSVPAVGAVRGYGP